MEPDDEQHLWRLAEVVLGEESDSRYVCELCPAVLVVPAGETPPATV